MAYYTIAHHLQAGVEDGSKLGPLGIKAEDLTDDVWDYILGDSQFPSDSQVPKEKLDVLRREFQYFYPFDVRSSGKDLIPNHLSFCIYNHAAMFPEKHWPRSMRINGHLMLNGKKMAKSTGNSLTMSQSVAKFGADATRLCLADAGDAIEDANFEEKTANANILRLFTLLQWSDEITADKSSLRTGPKDSFWDKVFENEINQIIAATDDFYSKMMFREAIKVGFYEFQTARDLYRDATADVGMHADLVERFISVQALLAAPIAPHFSEYLWKSTLKNESSIQNTRFPEPTAPADPTITAAATYVRGLVKTIRDTELALGRKKSKEPKVYVENKPKELRIFLAKSFPEWQDQCLKIFQENFDEKTGAVDDKKIRDALVKEGLMKNKKVMPFITNVKVSFRTGFGSEMKLSPPTSDHVVLTFTMPCLFPLIPQQKRVAELGTKQALNRSLLFDEREVLEAASSYLRRTLNFGQIHFQSAEEAVANSAELEGKEGFTKEMAESAEPGSRKYRGEK
jgi:leucyl-tRNA synthetase